MPNTRAFSISESNNSYLMYNTYCSKLHTSTSVYAHSSNIHSINFKVFLRLYRCSARKAWRQRLARLHFLQEGVDATPDALEDAEKAEEGSEEMGDAAHLDARSVGGRSRGEVVESGAERLGATSVEGRTALGTKSTV